MASSDAAPVMDWFTSQPSVCEVSAHGNTKSSVRFESGLQADIRVVSSEQFARTASFYWIKNIMLHYGSELIARI